MQDDKRELFHPPELLYVLWLPFTDEASFSASPVSVACGHVNVVCVCVCVRALGSPGGWCEVHACSHMFVH